METVQQIEIRRLKVSCHIGVPDEERSDPQQLLVTVNLSVGRPFAEMGDDLSKTLDYAGFAIDIQRIAGSCQRCLIETLAADIAAFALDIPIVSAVEVTVEKFILPDAECVAVSLGGVREVT